MDSPDTSPVAAYGRSWITSIPAPLKDLSILTALANTLRPLRAALHRKLTARFEIVALLSRQSVRMSFFAPSMSVWVHSNHGSAPSNPTT